MDKKIELIKQLGKLFSDNDNMDLEIPDRIPESERRMYLDNMQITGVIPKYKSVERLMLESFDLGKPVTTFPDLKNDPNVSLNWVSISPDYLKTILEICKITKGDNIVLSVEKDKPLKIENEFLIVYIAPRLTRDNEHPFKDF